MIKKPRFRLARKVLFLIASLSLLAAYMMNASRPGRGVEGCLEGVLRQLAGSPAHYVFYP